MNRTDITFPSSDGICAAWLYHPSDFSASDSHPIVVLGHGVAGVKEQRLDAFAERFVADGYPCLVFDYRHFGASTGEPRQLLDIPSQLEDWRNAVSFARTLDGIDPERVIIWGTSFGGGHVIVTAAEDHRIAAAISQCPFTDGFASGAELNPLTALRVSALGLADKALALVGRGPVYIPAYGLPGETALMTTPTSLTGVRNLGGGDVPIDVAARFAIDTTFHFPGRKAKDVQCPILFVIAEQDDVAPAAATHKYAAQAPRGEVSSLDAGHFEIYVGEEFEKNVLRQIDFLKAHVPA